MSSAGSEAASEAARGTGLILAGAAVSQVAEYLYRFALARGLGVEAFGTFNEARATLLVAVAFASVGLGAGVKRFAAMHREAGRGAEARRAIGDGGRILSVAAIAGAAALWLAARPIGSLFGDPALVGPLRVLALGLPALVALDYLTRVAESFRSFRPTVLARQLLDPGLRLAATVALLAAGGSVATVMGAYTGAAVVAALFAWILLRRLAPLRAPERGRAPSQSGALLRFSVPLVFGGVLFDLAERIDVLMIGVFLSERDVGVYAAGSALARSLLLFAASMMPVVSTLAAEAVGRGAPDDLSRLHRMASRWAFLCVAPLAVGLFLYPAEAISILFGRQYAEAAPAMRVLLPAYAAVALCGPLGVLVNALGKTHWTMVNMIGRVALNVGLNLWLIPRFGIVGAAAGTLVSLLAAVCVLRVQLGGLVSLRDSGSGWGRRCAALVAAAAVSWGVSRAVTAVRPAGEASDLVAGLLGGIALVAVFGVGIKRGLEPDDLALVGLVRGKLRRFGPGG